MPLRFARIAVPIFLLSAPAGARETRQLTAVRVGPGSARGDHALGLRVSQLSSFGEDARGRVYVTSLDGPVYRFASR